MEENTIRQIIFNNTFYHNGRYRHYPTISGLKMLINEIIESKLTCNHISINPFYINEKQNTQAEFDKYMFYMECRDGFDEVDIVSHIDSCIWDGYVDELDGEEIVEGHVLFPLCKYGDTVTFKKGLEAYLEYLEELLPKLLAFCKRTRGISDDDLAFGYFCFEVHAD